jgi:hypothetical protein
MSPSPEHELSKTLIGRFVETLAEELAVQIYPLGSTTFITSQASQFFPNLPIPEITEFLQQAGTTDYLELVKTFRNWVRSQIKK